MDCHVFRRLCDELAPALMGCRIEKIHRPAKDVTLFTLYGTGGKRFLFLRAGRKAPFLFLSTHKIPVGSASCRFSRLPRTRSISPKLTTVQPGSSDRAISRSI